MNNTENIKLLRRLIREVSERDIEREYFQRVIQRYKTGGVFPEVRDVKKLAAFMKKGDEELRETPASIGRVYRGITASLAEARGWFSDSGLGVAAPGDTGVIKTNYVMKPTNKLGHHATVTSWTSSLKAARAFADITSNDPDNVGLVYVAQVSDNPGVFLDISHMDLVNTAGVVDEDGQEVLAEMEHIALAPVRVREVQWFVPMPYSESDEEPF